MENRNLIRKFLVQKFKDQTSEQLKHKGKLFNMFSWCFLVLGLTFFGLAGFIISSSSGDIIIHNDPTGTDLQNVGLQIFSYIGALGCGILGIGFFIDFIMLEIIHRHIIVELRLREVTTSLLERLEKLEKQNRSA
jgi:hypothetical protein